MREMTRTFESMIDGLSVADRWELKMLATEDHGRLLSAVLHALAVEVAAEVRAAEQVQDELLAALEADHRAEIDAIPVPPPPPATGGVWFPEGEPPDEPPC